MAPGFCLIGPSHGRQKAANPPGVMSLVVRPRVASVDPDVKQNDKQQPGP